MPFKPNRAQLLAAAGRKVPDIIGPHLRVLFCGINPGLYSGATGHHFARPGNRFWRTLHGAGFTGRVLAPWEEHELLKHRCGVTNLVARATASADELHQTFLPGRTGTPWDVLIDCSGAITLQFLVYISMRIFKPKRLARVT